MSGRSQKSGGRRLVADRRVGRQKPAPSRSRSSGGGGGKSRTPAKSRQRAARKPRRSLLGRLFGFVFGLIWALIWRSTAVLLLIIAAASAYIYVGLPDLAEASDSRIQGSVTFIDREGEVFARRGSQFGGIAEGAGISPNLINAVVATEDRRFYWHPGFDPIGLSSAMLSNMRARGNPFDGAGGSTLAMQVSKLMCLGVAFDPTVWDSEAAYEDDCRRTTIWRKVQEVPWSIAITARYGRQGVLQVYLNRAYFGAGAYGVSAAMETYFDSTPAEASPQQAAMLAGLLTAPSRLAPTNDLERSQGRAAVVPGADGTLGLSDGG